MANSLYSHKHARLCSIIRRERKRLGWQQKQLAIAIGRSQSFVAKMENGQQRLEVLEFMEICDVLGYEAEKVISEIKAWSLESGYSQ